MIQVRAVVWQPGKDMPDNVRIAVTTPDGTKVQTEFDLRQLK